MRDVGRSIGQLRSPRRAIQACVGLLIIFATIRAPFALSGGAVYFWTSVMIMMIYVMSVNLIIGYGGLASFGQAAFFGTGAYAVALVAGRSLPPIVVIVGAAVLGAVVAFAAGLIVLRVSGLAFTMLTLAFAQSLYTLTFHVPSLGGENGLVGIQRGTLFGLNLLDAKVFWFFSLGCLLLMGAFIGLIILSPFGKAMQLIRDDPKRSAFLGINVHRYQLAAFTIAGFIGAFAGSLFAYQQGLVSPDALYWTKSGDPLLMSLVGGLGTFIGPLLGTALYMWVLNWLTAALPTSWILWVGAFFLVFVLFLPEGLMKLERDVRRGIARFRPGTDGDDVAVAAVAAADPPDGQ